MSKTHEERRQPNKNNRSHVKSGQKAKKEFSGEKINPLNVTNHPGNTN